ncbi:hypothetical protein [Catellatospora bangladeshensis]|uniref:Uncharacterized protein n=2 Tax=Catellatospora bangladeshensis TaxID=310355 RepID=A0A8J3JJU2_9ACTN|nr:hypothetical protein [Catellatospora bangladeshensis]GIF83864.1 hypothetical protein Cba03nite_52130 [Catellatospora bangladeshensis]
MSDTARTALLDQVDAANRNTVAALLAVADAVNARTTTGPLPTKALPLVESLALRLMEGRTTLCRDLSWAHPAPATWMPYAPGLIRCAACVRTVLARIKGTDQDFRCDGCGKYSRPLYPQAAMIPGQMLDLPEVQFTVSMPTITVTYGLCRRCR